MVGTPPGGMDFGAFRACCDTALGSCSSELWHGIRMDARKDAEVVASKALMLQRLEGRWTGWRVPPSPHLGAGRTCSPWGFSGVLHPGFGFGDQPCLGSPETLLAMLPAGGQVSAGHLRCPEGRWHKYLCIGGVLGGFFNSLCLDEGIQIRAHKEPQPSLRRAMSAVLAAALVFFL